MMSEGGWQREGSLLRGSKTRCRHVLVASQGMWHARVCMRMQEPFWPGGLHGGPPDGAVPCAGACAIQPAAGSWALEATMPALCARGVKQATQSAAALAQVVATLPAATGAVSSQSPQSFTHPSQTSPLLPAQYPGVSVHCVCRHRAIPDRQGRLLHRPSVRRRRGGQGRLAGDGGEGEGAVDCARRAHLCGRAACALRLGGKCE